MAPDSAPRYDTGGVRADLAKEFARETGGEAFTAAHTLNGFQDLLEKVIRGSKTNPRTSVKELCCCQQSVEQQ